MAYEGKRFAAHEPQTGCNGITTLAACMETGLGPDEFDCTGLVLRAIADVVGVSHTDLNPQYRHLRQVAALASPAALSGGSIVPEGFGVVRVGLVHESAHVPIPKHVGLYMTEGYRDGMVHATSNWNEVRFDFFARRTSLDVTKTVSPLLLAQRLLG